MNVQEHCLTFACTRTKAHTLLLVGLVMLLAAGLLGAEEERDLLIKISAEKRKAIIVSSDRNSAVCGCFIGNDGLAVLNLLGLVGDKAPDEFVLLASRAPLNAPILRYISPESGIAIAKFDYQPEVWIEPSSETIPLEDQVAILDPSVDWPIAIGPATSKINLATSNYLHPTYQTLFSIGAGLPAGRKSPPVNGSLVIDSEGRLRGTFNTTRKLTSQILLYASPSEQWFAEIAKARESQQVIPLPLPRELNPIDPASSHPDFRKAVIAAHENDFEQAIAFVKSALKGHPDSPLLHSLHFECANMANLIDELPILADATKPQRGANAAEFVSFYIFLAKARSRTGDNAGAGRALRKGFETAPKEESRVRVEYADWLMSDGKPEEAVRHLREAVDASPDNLQLLTKLWRTLTSLGEHEQSVEIRDRILEVESLYRLTTSSQLRPRPE